MILRSLFITTAVFLCSVGTAQADFYLSANYGTAKLELDTVSVKRADAFKVTGGYRFNNDFSVDVAYLSTGDLNVDPHDADNLDQLNGKMNFNGMVYSAAYHIMNPEESRLYMFVRASIYDFDAELTDLDTNTTSTESSAGLGWGLGIGFFVIDGLALAFELESYAETKTLRERENLTLLSGLLVYHF